MTDAPPPFPDELGVLKRRLRKRLAAARDTIAPDLRAAAAVRLACIGIGFAHPRPRAVVSAYAAIGSELDPGPVLASLSRQGSPTCLPVVQPRGNPLRFHAWKPGDPLVARTWGIQEPDTSVPEVEPDILLVPLLAFDRQGFRLGYGGGYYDRTLERLRKLKPTVAIGIAYAEQEIEAVPSGPHDQRLDWVLTPAGPIRPRMGP